MSFAQQPYLASQFLKLLFSGSSFFSCFFLFFFKVKNCRLPFHASFRLHKAFSSDASLLWRGRQNEAKKWMYRVKEVTYTYLALALALAPRYRYEKKRKIDYMSDYMSDYRSSFRITLDVHNTENR